MNEVEEYIFNYQGFKREILLYFHAMLVEEFQLKPKIAYKIPMYYQHKWVVYLNPDNREGVELAFPNGFRFQASHELLESKGRKMVRSVEFKSLEEIPENNIRAILEEAIFIDNKLKKN